MRFPDQAAIVRRNELTAHISEYIATTHAPGTLYGIFPKNATQMQPYGAVHMLHPACFESKTDAAWPQNSFEAELIGDRVESQVSDVEAAALTGSGRMTVSQAVQARLRTLSSVCRIDPGLWKIHHDAHASRDLWQRDAFTAHQEARWRFMSSDPNNYLESNREILGLSEWHIYSAGKDTPDVMIPSGNDPRLAPSLALATHLFNGYADKLAQEPGYPATPEDVESVQYECLATAQAIGLLLMRTIEKSGKIRSTSENLQDLVSGNALPDFMLRTHRSLIKTFTFAGFHISQPLTYQDGQLTLSGSTQEYLIRDSLSRAKPSPEVPDFDRSAISSIGYGLLSAFNAIHRPTPKR